MTRKEAIDWQKRLFPPRNSMECYPTLLEICQDVRIALNGSADPWKPDRMQEVCDMLWERWKTWQDPEDTFDQLVKGILLCVVKMAHEQGEWKHGP